MTFPATLQGSRCRWHRCDAGGGWFDVKNVTTSPKHDATTIRWVYYAIWRCFWVDKWIVLPHTTTILSVHITSIGRDTEEVQKTCWATAPSGKTEQDTTMNQQTSFRQRETGLITGLLQQYYHFRAIVWARISARSVQVDGSWEPPNPNPAPMTLPIVSKSVVVVFFTVLAL